MPAGQPGPGFDDDLWDFTDVVGLPVEMPLSVRRLDFTAIIPRWRLVAKELMLALLAPRHPVVAPLPRAYRTPLHLRTCHARLAELTRLLNWLAEHGLTTLDQVSDDHCHAYLAHRRHAADNNGRPISPRSPTTRRAAAQAVIDLVSYRDLFTSDRLPAQLRPWNGAAP